ncbi:hypothetical protein BaRGS_00011297 [Batillaria attramentaria]|uniref:Uncharacterized protein n=1 Tax=Batillaria attramentaria TaxID=370345 RepID=A0ABD0LDP9_9CAEN
MVKVIFVTWSYIFLVEDSVPIVGGVDHAVLLLILILVISRTDPMVNGFYRRKRDDEKDLYDRYLGKGMEQNSQVRIYMPLSPVLSTLHVYPATPVYDDYCANPWMRPEMLRVGSFRGVALQEDSPLRLAGDGYYFRRHDTTIVCFCCGSSWPFHRHDCRRMLLNIPFNQGVGQPPEPSMALQATETATIQADISLRRARAEDVHHGQDTVSWPMHNLLSETSTMQVSAVRSQGLLSAVCSPSACMPTVPS